MIELSLPHSEWALAYFILEWVLRLAFIVLVLPHRSPTAARIWLLFGFLAPVPAAVIYALIGRVRNPRRRQERERGAAQKLAEWLADMPASACPHSPLARFVTDVGGNPPAAGNTIRLLTDYEGTVDAIVEAIEKARRQVRVMTYILADDAVGRRVIAALAQARARGVSVQVMFDAFGSRPWRKAVLARLREADIEARACNIYSPLAGGTGRLDRRNHRKIYVIDDALGFMGSQNLVSREFRKGVVNHEVMMRIEGPLAAELAAQFVSDWIADGGSAQSWPRHPGKPEGGACAQLLASGPEQPVEAYTLLLSRLLHEARRSILIASPYTVLDEGLQLAVVTAAMRGVEVTLLVSEVVDQPLVRLAQEAGYDALLAAGVSIREFSAGLLHAKYVLVDAKTAVVGTSNADIRSFQINSEISVISEDKALVRAMEQVAQAHLGCCDEIRPEQWAARPLRRRMLQKVAALAGPLL